MSAAPKNRRRTLPTLETENKVLEGLIKKFTALRDWSMVEDLFNTYGAVLELREKSSR